MNSLGVNIHHNDIDPFPVVFYTSIRNLYISLTKTLSRFFVKVLLYTTIPILALTSPIWVTVIYFIIRNSNRIVQNSFDEIEIEWKDEPKNEEMFDHLIAIKTFKSLFEKDGDFKYPKHRLIFKPFTNQFRRFYDINKNHMLWLEEKIYPSYEELGISEEDAQFVLDQLTEEDLRDIRDDDWGEVEKEILFG